jgi:hypothetical protein
VLRDDADEPRVYRVTVSESAEAFIDDTYFQLLGKYPDFAERWHDGIQQAIRDLSMFPQIHAIAETESVRAGRTVRCLLFRVGRMAQRVLFTVFDSDGDGTEDAVRVMHIRHAAQSDPREPLP